MVFRKSLCLCLLLSVLFCFFTNGSSEESVTVEDGIHVKITFLGDCTLGCREIDLGSDHSFAFFADTYGTDYFFSQLLPILQSDDLTVGNLECVFSDSSAGEVHDKVYRFRGPTDYTDILRSGSIEAVSLANNHTFDYGENGIRDTISALDAAGIAYFGVIADKNEKKVFKDLTSTYIYEKNGVRIGFVSAWISVYNIPNMKRIHKMQIQELQAEGCDLIIACFHGGMEYGTKHDIQNEAKDFLNYGCDIVIGNHPHVLQGIEICKKGMVKDGSVDKVNGTIVYCLGNCCFGGNPQIKSKADVSAIIQFDFCFDQNDHTYLGHTMTIYPTYPSTTDTRYPGSNFADYQPKFAVGSEAERIMKIIQSDSSPRSFVLNPYVDGIGAVQDFVPNPKLSSK